MSRSATRHSGRHVPGAGSLAVGLAATMVVATFFQFALGAFAPQIVADIDLSVADVGLVTGTLFLVAVPLSPVAGRIVDRIGAWRGLAVVLTAAAVATVLIATAGSRTALLVAVLPASVALAGGTPVTNRLAREAAAPHTRNVLVATAQTGVQMGALGTGVLVLLGPRLGWRPLLASALAVVALAAVAATAGRRRGVMAEVPADPPDAPAAVRGPGRTPPGLPVRAYTLFAVCMALPGGFTVAYLATFLDRETTLGPAAAGATASVYGAVALVSRASLHRLLPPERNVLPALALTSVGAASALALVAVAPAAPGVAWLGAALFGATGLTWPAILMVSVVRRMEVRRTASVTGTILAAFYLGSWLGPVAAGRALDGGVAFGMLWRVAAGAYLLALLPLAWARLGQPRPDRAGPGLDGSSAGDLG